MHEFFEHIFGEAIDSQRRLALFTVRDRRTRLFDNIEDAVALAQQRSVRSDVYFGLGLIEGSPSGRGRYQDVAAIGALWADIDMQSSVHPRQQLPVTLDEARRLLSQVPLQPSLVVGTGHGLHAYWLLHEPWVFESGADRDRAALLSKGWHGLICAEAARKEWSLENLGDLTRILRPPGTVNHRDAEHPVAVELLEAEYHRRFSAADFEEFLPRDAEAPGADIEINDLRLLPDAQPPADKLVSAVTESALFRRTWEHDRPDLTDQSQSGYDLSLATTAALRGWADQEIADLIIAARRQQGDKPEKALRPDYIRRTLTLARRALPEAATTDVNLSGILSTFSGESDLDPEPRDPGPFPAQLLADTPAIVRCAMDYYLSCAIEAQPVLFLASFIAATGTVLGHKVQDRSGLRTNIYTVGISGTGGGKEATRETVFKILQHAGLEALCGQEDFASDSGLISAVDEQNPILFQVDEFGRFMHCVNVGPQRSPHTYNIASVLLKFYSKANSTFRSKAYADSKRNRSICQPHVCLYGTTVASNFWTAMDKDSLEGGFLPRTLIFESTADPQPGGQVESDPPQEVTGFFADWANRVCTRGNLERVYPDPAVVPLTDEAERYLNELRALQKSQQKRQDGLGVLWSRARENAGKLALIHACWEHPEQPVVDDVAASWAIQVVTHVVEHAMYQAHLCVAESPFHQRCQRVLQAIAKATSQNIKHRDLTRQTRGMSPREREEAIDALIEQGRVNRWKEETSGRPGIWYGLA